jgi:small subunit ribosomal protein S6
MDPELSQDQRDQVIQRIEELITQMDGFLVFTDNWGERKLAYDIKKRARGYYVRFDYCGLSPLVNEIERFSRIDDRALKYMTVLLDNAPDLEKIKGEKAEAESKAKVKEELKEAAKEVQPAPVEAAQEEPAPIEAAQEEPAPLEAARETEAVPQEAAVEVEPAPVEAAPETEPVPQEAAVEVEPAPLEDTAPVEKNKQEDVAPTSDASNSAADTTPLMKNPEEA